MILLGELLISRIQFSASYCFKEVCQFDFKTTLKNILLEIIPSQETQAKLEISALTLHGLLKNDQFLTPCRFNAVSSTKPSNYEERYIKIPIVATTRFDEFKEALYCLKHKMKQLRDRKHDKCHVCSFINIYKNFK